MKYPSFRLLVFALAAGIAMVAAGGCANPGLVRVHPWERAALADYVMRPDRDPVGLAMSDHIYISREAANGGRGVGGSGCGCN